MCRAAARHFATRDPRSARYAGVIVGLLLAAGGARRFGSQKLVAPLGDTTVVRHAAESLAQSTDALIVVVGSEAVTVARALHGVNATIVENAEWERGLSTSIRCGVASATPETSALLIALGDEPLVNRDVPRAVIAAWRATGKPIVVPRYAGESGHPALFEPSIFAELMALEGDAGAKRVINRLADRVAYVDIAAERPLDVDQAADLRRLERGSSDAEDHSPSGDV
jgi:molybdenum cofactor cytidylyltransferase